MESMIIDIYKLPDLHIHDVREFIDNLLIKPITPYTVSLLWSAIRMRWEILEYTTLLKSDMFKVLCQLGGEVRAILGSINPFFAYHGSDLTQEQKEMFHFRSQYNDQPCKDPVEYEILLRPQGLTKDVKSREVVISTDNEGREIIDYKKSDPRHVISYAFSKLENECYTGFNCTQETNIVDVQKKAEKLNTLVPGLNTPLIQQRTNTGLPINNYPACVVANANNVLRNHVPLATMGPNTIRSLVGGDNSNNGEDNIDPLCSYLMEQQANNNSHIIQKQSLNRVAGDLVNSGTSTDDLEQINREQAIMKAHLSDIEYEKQKSISTHKQQMFEKQPDTTKQTKQITRKSDYVFTGPVSTRVTLMGTEITSLKHIVQDIIHVNIQPVYYDGYEDISEVLKALDSI